MSKLIFKCEKKTLQEKTNEDPGVGKAVKNAHLLENPLETLESLAIGSELKNGKKCEVKHFKAQQLSASQEKWLMDLMTRNMKHMYKKALDGWRPKKKWKEMTEKTSRYLIATVDGKPVAFSHFRFDMDYGREVLYCYEIQVESATRSIGLGKLIMEILEKMASQANLPLVVLTVFKFNLPSLGFFKNLGYDVDETSPGDDEFKDYVIMSKSVC
ncbi:N-alpha-acetyltransferase 40 [Orchesella cincta]|uniref:N-alpha-acetyltransferase 40 n=1 Tax=Orchesella cincta TaxID=48709 RepID=A0A1D2MBM1_ORCCI|nr:N-alpha-acetyltransferase 40 [Orchesella cincta]